MGIKVAIPALGQDTISENLRPIHRSRVSAEDYIWNAYSSMGQYIFGQYKYLSQEIKKVKNNWRSKYTWLLFF